MLSLKIPLVVSLVLNLILIGIMMMYLGIKEVIKVKKKYGLLKEKEKNEKS